jgi:hypothetical protein
VSSLGQQSARGVLGRVRQSARWTNRSGEGASCVSCACRVRAVCVPCRVVSCRVVLMCVVSCRVVVADVKEE